MNTNSRISKFPRVLLICVGILVISGGWGLPVLAAGEVVQAEILPASLQVPPQGSASALLVLRNPTADELDITGLSYFPEDNVIIRFNSTVNVVPAGGVVFWNLDVERKNSTLSKQNVYIIIKHESKSAGGGQAVQAAEIVPLEITATAAAANTKPVDVSTRMAEGTVMENHPGVVYLFLQNTSGENLSVDAIKVDSDPALDVTTDVSLPLVLAPFDQVDVPYTVVLRKNSLLQPGKTTVAFTITALTLESRQPVLAAASQDITTGVLGESSLLTLLGVPSLLVLPGFLMVTTFLALWGWKPGGDAKIGVKDPAFWLMAISLSMLTALLYPPLTHLFTWMGILTQPRNYLTGYGLADILVLWVFSIVISAVVYFVVLAWRMLTAAQRTPSEKDTQLSLLGKLYRQGMGIACQSLQVTTKSNEKITGFLLEPWSEEAKEVWIGPGIILTWKEGKDPHSLKPRIKELLNKDTAHDLKALVSLLEEGMRENSLNLEWKVDNGLYKVRKVSVGERIKQGVPQIIIRPEL